MSVKLLTEHNLEFLRLKGGCTGSSESALVKLPHCWKSHVAAHMCLSQPVDIQIFWVNMVHFFFTDCKIDYLDQFLNRFRNGEE